MKKSDLGEVSKIYCHLLDDYFYYKTKVDRLRDLSLKELDCYFEILSVCEQAIHALDVVLFGHKTGIGGECGGVS